MTATSKLGIVEEALAVAIGALSTYRVRYEPWPDVDRPAHSIAADALEEIAEILEQKSREDGEQLAEAHERLHEAETYLDELRHIYEAQKREIARFVEALSRIGALRENWDSADTSNQLDFTDWFWQAVGIADAALVTDDELDWHGCDDPPASDPRPDPRTHPEHWTE